MTRDHEAFVTYRAGRFNFRLFTSISRLKETVSQIYAPLDPDNIVDFEIAVQPQRWYRPQVTFKFQQTEPFLPLPANQAYPLLEWGMNWCVTQHCHQYLIIHAAVLEKNNKVIILPGSPGSGKSTLSAALCLLDGWNLLSDEMALVDTTSGLVFPSPRPISLKNASIDIVSQFPCAKQITPSVKDTTKGTVAHLVAPCHRSFSIDQGYPAVAVVFPTYTPTSTCNRLNPITVGNSFMRLIENSFNYHILRQVGFDALGQLANACGHYTYPNNGNFSESFALLNELIR
ncbi:HprK-related kinase A [Bowmanella sp. JS7-9]|uniref:HprK-related kinase A n=1 Tax=Alteromonadaceae TaxID=72275 RepID=UPI00103C465B|nr:HprK-related kinase A [Bowmanella sp. JS7-9]TBX20867.1 hypothetical protein TK45_13930 [Bowmanella sp. JS7-9]